MRKKEYIAIVRRGNIIKRIELPEGLRPCDINDLDSEERDVLLDSSC